VLRRLALALLVSSAVLGAQAPAVPRNAFAGFETVQLPNGLRIWFKRLPGELNVSVNLTVAVGSDQDPSGQEQLAHFLEHMLFADHRGKTTLEIKREIEDRGGSYNGVTWSDRTTYFVDIDKAHAQLAIDWLGRIVSPHTMDPQVVEREREPVGLEIGATPRQAYDWLQAWYVDPPLLRIPDFWRREFGMAPARVTEDVDLYRTIHRIGPAELKEFYNRWYAPERMTLVFVGDVDRDSVMIAARSAFGGLPAHPAAAPGDTIRDPGRTYRYYGWQDRPNVSYLDRYKIYQRSAGDDVKLEFIAAFLQQRLENRLRFGERKAVYGLSANVNRRGRAAVLQLSASIKEAEFSWARGVIDEEIAALRDGTLSDSVFSAERFSVARMERVQSASARNIAGWATNRFYDTRVHSDFPDVVTAFESITRGEASRYAREVFAPERRVLQVIAPFPLPQTALLVIALLLGATAILLARGVFLRSVDMTRLRYVARFRLPLVYRVLVLPLALALLAVGFRVLVYVYQRLADRWLTSIASFWVQWAIYGVLAMLTLFLFIAAFSRWPRKLLVFDDGVAVKYLSYRSVPVPAAEITELAMLRFGDVWTSRRIRRCTPLAFGFFTPAIYLRRSDGRAWYFRTRDVAECLRVLGAARSAGLDAVGDTNLTK
jgi:predicted Zn-dependent peptidase